MSVLIKGARMIKSLLNRLYFPVIFFVMSYLYFVLFHGTVVNPIIESIFSDFLSELNTVRFFLMFLFISFFLYFLPIVIDTLHNKFNHNRKKDKFGICFTIFFALICFYGVPYFEAIVSNVDVFTPDYTIYAQSVERHSLFIFLRVPLIMMFIGQVIVDLYQLNEK